MASYPEYSSSTMPTSNGETDFTLYSSYHDHYTQAPAFATTAYAGNYYTPSASYESYPPPQAFAGPQLHDFTFHQNQTRPAESKFPAQSPAYSPANSAAHSFDFPAPHLSTTSDSGASVQSTISSAMASPSLNGQNLSDWTATRQTPLIQHDTHYSDMYPNEMFDAEPLSATEKVPGCVDPSLIDPFATAPFTNASFPPLNAVSQSPHNNLMSVPVSPVQSTHSGHSSRTISTGPIRTGRTSKNTYMPYSAHPTARRDSVASDQSHGSRQSQSSLDSSDENKGVCPIASCGRQIKDIKAHMLTHQNERPEKCPIATCEYHLKGFARKYDKNRHTLTHYKGTMVCGFCPGSGSASEKSFNRADVFKRHLTSVHGVEQTAPNARRKSPVSQKQALNTLDASGTCSTCGITFVNAQAFYEHLDDCVLRVVQQIDPSEAINERLLTSVADDPNVQETFRRNGMSTSLDYAPTSFAGGEDLDEEEEGDEDNKTRKGLKRRATQELVSGSGSAGGSNYNVNGHKRVGLTYSRGGVTLNGPSSAVANKSSKRRRNYPLSWGAAPDKMRMKKRVLCVYDGPRRLWKDDMMLDSEHEVRVTLPGNGEENDNNGGQHARRWVTDLDVQTLKRAEGLHWATDEEKGPWLDESGEGIDIAQLMAR